LRAAVSHKASRSNQHSTRSKAGGWNRIHLIAGDLPGKVERLRAAGALFRNEAAANRGSAVAQNEPTKLTEVYFPALTGIMCFLEFAVATRRWLLLGVPGGIGLMGMGDVAFCARQRKGRRRG
jgi:hypothetical protein